ncbi:MAG TPA: hypothetical protein VHZ24_11800 [Pirellulales bacterium]|nr:hypothetical protein [Pirellulales bacterium]
MKQLTIPERPGKDAFRFWQEGGGYDRNLTTSKAAYSVIDYLHLNPVRRGLVEHPRQWKWSSFRYYESDGMHVEPDTPRIDPLPQ